jgi:alkanesulfonate monooxygenase SsuD/methylene tetrahydromethanopterin reductase-like flavin-dependent oxidoreductase (luciferase family)
MDFGGQRFDVDHLVDYVETATALGFDSVAVNDHLVFGTPWLDGLSALAAVVGCSGHARLFTTVANPVVRGPAPLAKALAGLDVMSGGRLTAALGPGSSRRDYDSVGLPFEERWPRFDEAVRAVRSLLRGDAFEGGFYRVDGPLEPLATQTGGPPLWVGSWGSEVGIRRAVRIGDGWLASTYNTTPEQFGQGWAAAQRMLGEAGRDPAGFGNGLATMWFHIDERHAGEVFEERLAPVMSRPAEELRERLPFGPAEAMAERLAAWREAGVQRVFLWPVSDELEQLRRFAELVRPALAA